MSPQTKSLGSSLRPDGISEWRTTGMEYGSITMPMTEPHDRERNVMRDVCKPLGIEVTNHILDGSDEPDATRVFNNFWGVQEHCEKTYGVLVDNVGTYMKVDGSAFTVRWERGCECN